MAFGNSTSQPVRDVRDERSLQQGRHTTSRRSQGRARPGKTAAPCRAEPHAAAFGLRLPRLGGAVPAAIGVGDAKRAAGLAAMMLDCGLVPPGIRTWDADRLEAMCEEALQHWIDERTGPLHLLTVAVDVEGVKQWQWGRENVGQLTLSCYATAIARVFCAGTLDRLRRVDVRLPYAVLERVRALSWKAVPIMSCAEQIDVAQWLMWGGTESREDHAAEQELEGEDLEQYLASTLSREDILAATPAWVLEPVGGQRSGMTDAALAKVAIRTTDSLVSQILATIEALGKQWTPTADLHSRARDDGGEFVGYSALVRYNEDDQTEHLAEYLCNYAMESGEGYEVVLSLPVSIGEREALRDVLNDLGAWLNACHLLDRLLWLLSGADSVYGGAGT